MCAMTRRRMGIAVGCILLLAALVTVLLFMQDPDGSAPPQPEISHVALPKTAAEPAQVAETPSPPAVQANEVIHASDELSLDQLFEGLRRACEAADVPAIDQFMALLESRDLAEVSVAAVSR